MINRIAQSIHGRFNGLIDRWTSPTFAAIPDNRSESDNGRYVALVKKALRNDRCFNKFKRHRHFREILEHVTEEQGRQYINELQKQSPDLIDRIDSFKTNDLIGDPIRYKYADPVGVISPTTLRYLKVASDIKILFEELDDCTIVEIGVGYGGQLLILDSIIRVQSYFLMDLPEVLTLASRYLESHILNMAYSCKTINQYGYSTCVDLAMSNYAFSELPLHLQQMYISKVLLGAKRGYLTMNSGLALGNRLSDRLSIEQLRKLLPPFEIIKERPLTGIGNYIIVWGHNPSAVIAPRLLI